MNGKFSAKRKPAYVPISEDRVQAAVTELRLAVDNENRAAIKKKEQFFVE